MTAKPINYIDIVRTLCAEQVDFVVCGGVACVLQGVQRVTHDIDINVAMDSDNLKRLVAAARRLGFQPRSPEPLEAIIDPSKRKSWIEHKQATVFTLVSSEGLQQIDIFLQYPIDFDDLKSRADRIVKHDVSILVSSKDDLITAKRAVDPVRTKDIRDIEDLQAIIQRERA